MEINPPASEHAADYRYPRFAFDTGWPLVIVYDGETFVRVRDGAPVERTEGGGMGHSALYARVADAKAATLDTTAMYEPSTSINERHEGSKLLGMLKSQWVTNEELAAARVPVYEVPDVAKVLDQYADDSAPV